MLLHDWRNFNRIYRNNFEKPNRNCLPLKNISTTFTKVYPKEMCYFVAVHFEYYTSVNLGRILISEVITFYLFRKVYDGNVSSTITMIYRIFEKFLVNL